MYIERVMSHKWKNWVAVRVESGVAGEGRIIGVPKFHSWGKCTVSLTIINSDWMSNASDLCINLFILIIYTSPLFRILGCNYQQQHHFVSKQHFKKTSYKTMGYQKWVFRQYGHWKVFIKHILAHSRLAIVSQAMKMPLHVCIHESMKSPTKHAVHLHMLKVGKQVYQ